MEQCQKRGNHRVHTRVSCSSLLHVTDFSLKSLGLLWVMCYLVTRTRLNVWLRNGHTEHLVIKPDLWNDNTKRGVCKSLVRNITPAYSPLVISTQELYSLLSFGRIGDQEFGFMCFWQHAMHAQGIMGPFVVMRFEKSCCLTTRLVLDSAAACPRPLIGHNWLHVTFCKTVDLHQDTSVTAFVGR